MTQAELVADLVRRAGAASERLAELRTDVKDAATAAGRGRPRGRLVRSILRANAQDLEAGSRPGPRCAPAATALTLNAGADRGHGCRPARGRRPARPGRRDHPDVEPAERPAGRAHADSLGVILVIYESRPNVTCATSRRCACKTGNAAILRGGSEALHSNRAIADVLRDAVAPRRGRARGRGAARGQIPSASSWTSCSRDDAIDLVIPARRREPDPAGGRAVADPGDQALPGHLPRVSRRVRRAEDGARDRGELEGAARVGVQLGRDLARARGARGQGAARRARRARRTRRRAARLRAHARALPAGRSPPRTRTTTPSGWPRSCRCAWSTRWTRRSSTSASTARTTPRRSSRRTSARARVRPPGELELGVRERQHALLGRLPARPGRRGGRVDDRRCTGTGRWASRGSRRRSSSPSERGRFSSEAGRTRRHVRSDPPRPPAALRRVPRSARARPGAS